MSIQIHLIESFNIIGYAIETNLEKCNIDIPIVSKKFNDNFHALNEKSKSVYGLMWYTENHNYYYLIGIKTNSTKEPESEQTLKTIIKTEYAVYTVPNDMTIIDAWTDFFPISYRKMDTNQIMKLVYFLSIIQTDLAMNVNYGLQ